MMLWLQQAPVKDTAQQISQRAYPFFAASIAVGLLSMAIIQVFKDLLPVRRWFQQWWVRKWLEEKHSLVDKKEGRALIGESDQVFSTGTAETQLVQLATDGDANAFYNLPIEQLCGQLNAAAQAVLENPSDYKVLLLHLGARAELSDLRTLITDTAQFRTPPTLDSAPDRSTFQAFVDARNRVGHQVQRAIDALQLSCAQRWKLWIQMIAIALSFVIALLSIQFFVDIHGTDKAKMVAAISIMGGFMAPIARDLIAGLQSLRK
jgi:hypothetical protein